MIQCTSTVSHFVQIERVGGYNCLTLYVKFKAFFPQDIPHDCMWPTNLLQNIALHMFLCIVQRNKRAFWEKSNKAFFHALLLKNKTKTSDKK